MVEKIEELRERIRQLQKDGKINLPDVEQYLKSAPEAEMTGLVARFDRDKGDVTEQQKVDLKKLIDAGKVKLAQNETFDEYLGKLNRQSAHTIIRNATPPAETRRQVKKDETPPAGAMGHARKDEIPAEAFLEFDRLDEHQITEMLEGRTVDEYIYSFEVGGKQVEGISYSGTIDCAKYYSEVMVKQGKRPMEVVDYTLLQDEHAFRVFVRVREPEAGVILPGYASQPKERKKYTDRERTQFIMVPDDKADVIAVSKATRNGMRNAMPMTLVRGYIAAVKAGMRK